MTNKVLANKFKVFSRHNGLRCISVQPKYEFLPKKYTGPSMQQTDEIKSKFFPPSVYNIYKKPVLLHQGHMQYLYDHEGRKYLDLFGGIVTVSVGHCHPKVVSALKKQIETLWHTTNIYRHPKIYDYIQKLVSKFPGDLKVVYLVNSGTEANDLATVLAKAYTGNHDIISLQNSYHGYSSALMGLTATQSYRMPLPVPPGFYHAMLPDPFRGIWGGCRDSLSQVPGSCTCPGDCDSTEKYIHQLKELLENSVPAGKIAGLFAESIQGVNGTVQFPKGYLRKAYELVKKYGGVYIADEGAYEQKAHLMVSDHRRPWILATPGVSQMRCRPLRKEYALLLKVFGSYRSGNTAGDNIFHSFVVRGKKFRQKRTVVDSHASR